MPRPKFKAGNAGKPKGAKNKITKTVKERVLDTFNSLQEDNRANLTQWAKENPTEFYKIAAKLIPTEVDATVTANVITVIRE